MPTVLTYNGFDLNGSVVSSTSLDDGDAPERLFPTFNIPGGGLVFGDDDWMGKPIPAEGIIKGTSVADLEAQVDAFKAALAAKDKNFDVSYASGTRRYVARASRIQINEKRHAVTSAPWSAIFMTTGVGVDTSATSLLTSSADTTASRNVTGLSIGGSHPDQLLKTQVTVTAATGLIGKTITIQNPATSEAISITRDWTVGEVLEVDASWPRVRINATVIDFVGAFPIYSPGTQGMLITNDFTTRTLTTTISYTKRYL